VKKKYPNAAINIEATIYGIRTWGTPPHNFDAMSLF